MPNTKQIMSLPLNNATQFFQSRLHGILNSKPMVMPMRGAAIYQLSDVLPHLNTTRSVFQSL